jgi:hypothetical protein
MSLTYNGNPFLKSLGVQIPYTIDQIQEYKKCQDDPIYFIDNYCKIVSLDKGLITFKLYDCQKNKIKILHENRRVILMEHRQAGKCVSKSTLLNIRNKKTGEVLHVTAEEFHNMQKLQDKI